MKYQYDWAIHFKEPTKKEINIIRLLGVIFILIGAIDLFYKFEDSSLYTRVINFIMIAVGLLMILFTKMSLKSQRKEGKYFVEMDDDTITWNLEKNHQSLSFAEVEQCKMNSGDIRFKKKDGSVVILPTHKILIMDKFIELRKLLKAKFEVLPQG